MKRCFKCLLPSSLSGSDFDETGTCSWCRSGYPNFVPKGEESLRNFIEENRGGTRSADCLVGVSGGKDSSYVATQLKTEFGIKVEAFTYVHEGSSPSSLENARNVCKNLDIRHNEISLPNHQHLRSFQSFFQAWLKMPNTTTAAMTCVACKHLHIMGTQLAVRRNIPMIFWSTCPLEVSPFIAINLRQEGEDQFEREGMLKSAGKLIKEIIVSPYFGASVFRHFGLCVNGCLAFVPSSGFLKMRYPQIRHVYFFDYCDWNPSDIVKTIVEKAGWKPPEEVPDDWHSDCVFNIFKEYMFQKMLGISYTDGFLSNQIRHGLLTRPKAWKKLLSSKDYYMKALPKALDFVGLGHLRKEIDTSCFETRDTVHDNSGS